MGSGKVPDGWHLHDSVDTQTGPFTWDEVLKLTHAGKVTSEFKIYHPEQTKGGWVSVEKSPPLRKIFAELKLLHRAIEIEEKVIEPEVNLLSIQNLPARATADNGSQRKSSVDYRFGSLLVLIWVSWLGFVAYVGCSVFLKYDGYGPERSLLPNPKNLYAISTDYGFDFFTASEWTVRAVKAAGLWGCVTIVAPVVLSFVAWAFLKASNPAKR